MGNPILDILEIVYVRYIIKKLLDSSSLGTQCLFMIYVMYLSPNSNCLR